MGSEADADEYCAHYSGEYEPDMAGETADWAEWNAENEQTIGRVGGGHRMSTSTRNGIKTRNSVCV